MCIQPFNVRINKNFRDITESNIEFNTLEEIRNKTHLLFPYDNYALTFYHKKLFFFSATGEDFIVFGHDLEGYFVVSVKDGIIYHLTDNKDCDIPFSLVFCNTNINHFINFNNLFIFMVMEQSRISGIETKNNINDEKIFDTLDRYYIECDPLAMNEDNFWYTRCYALRDGFFPTNNSQIEFYKEMMLKLS
ncbi:hypothetical protein EC412_05035 [Salmonella enterica subsp. enterica serovar Redlands]|nr:hypothetical protein [Salmonella enterica subsp. enterica serovar Redlands]